MEGNQNKDGPKQQPIAPPAPNQNNVAIALDKYNMTFEDVKRFISELYEKKVVGYLQSGGSVKEGLSNSEFN
jgi:hypothetical protein